MGEEKSDFEKWVEEAELQPDTVRLLAENGFVSLKAVRKLTGPMLTKHFGKSVPLGQFLLLESAVDELKPVKTSQADTESINGSHIAHTPAVEGVASTSRQPAADFPEVVAPGDMQLLQEGINLARLSQLFGAGTIEANDRRPTEISAGKTNVFDPFQFYDSNVSGNCAKAKDIRDYMLFKKNGHNQGRPDIESSIKIGEVDVTIAGAGKKIPLDKVSPMQFVEANMSILREMIIQDKVPMQTVVQYIGYVTKLACMSQAFQWNLILKYDDEYRRQQAAMCFPWGADSPFLHHLFLGQDSKHTPPATDSKREVGRTKYDPNSGQTICDKFNGRNRCNYRNCRYRHVCKTCYSSSHGEVQHKTPQTTPAAQTTLAPAPSTSSSNPAAKNFVSLG